MTIDDVLTVALIVAGLFFFLAGTTGLLRFPDIYTRLHALTKADHLGLGLMVMGLALQAEAWTQVGKLVLVWIVMLAAVAVSSHLIANAADREEVAPWRKPE